MMLGVLSLTISAAQNSGFVSTLKILVIPFGFMVVIGAVNFWQLKRLSRNQTPRVDLTPEADGSITLKCLNSQRRVHAKECVAPPGELHKPETRTACEKFWAVFENERLLFVLACSDAVHADSIRSILKGVLSLQVSHEPFQFELPSETKKLGTFPIPNPALHQ